VSRHTSPQHPDRYQPSAGGVSIRERLDSKSVSTCN
jgi:hypothetical protein